MVTRVRALRGATTVEADTVEAVSGRVHELLAEIFEANALSGDELISVIITATDDIRSVFPAAAAREFGLDDVPLLCARELDIEGAEPLCIRILIHLETDLERSALRHVYLHGATKLRADLAR